MLHSKELVQKTALKQAIKDGMGPKNNTRFTLLKSRPDVN